MIHVAVKEGRNADSIGFSVKFDDATDAQAVLNGERVQIGISPALSAEVLGSDEVQGFLSDLIGSAAQDYFRIQAH